MNNFGIKTSDPSIGLRLPKELLATVDAICEQHDLTRSQVVRHSVMEYLKNRNIAIKAAPTEPNSTWSEHLFNRGR
jgi:antitoxin component of RelBE/YafQ-DinJ toxin-antitoxin module